MSNIAGIDNAQHNFDDIIEIRCNEIKSDDGYSDDGCSDDDDGRTIDGLNEDADETTKLDTKRVVLVRVFLILTLVVSSIIMACVAYRYISKNEFEQFEKKFRNDASKVLEAVGSSLERTLGALNSIAVAYVSYAAANNDTGTWPLVTLPDFALLASKLLPLTDGVYVSIQPIIYPSQKLEWEKYAARNDHWVNQTLAIQEVWGGYYGDRTKLSWERNEHIYGAFGDIEPNVSRYMLPQWQSFPIAPEDGLFVYNFDWNAELNPEGLQICLERQHTVLSKPYMIPFPDDEIANTEMEIWSNFFTSFLPPEDKAFEPMLDVHYPVINDLTPNAVLGVSGTNTTSVGMLAIPIYWRSFIRNILTKGSDGIVVVVHNSCTQPFTYQINGPQVSYMGVGDRHDVKYDDLVEMSKVVEMDAFSLKNSGYSGAPIDLEYCPYTIQVYPSDTMKDYYVTKDASIFVISVFAIFLFTSLVFYIYDRFVERRQYRVKSAAMHSSAIVSSLFPSTVRDQVFPLTHQQNDTKKTQLPSSGAIADSSMIRPIVGGPIAQVYPDTTVIFADIVGFTAWSASRNATQVFHLLETIYAGFDGVARMLGVFKIETIGDCYVAVVGLPKSRKLHAVIMAKFASLIRAKMVELTNNLEETLGPETANLALRVGLNSGPTTAGVLRGEKARFQLFGDTVNTAARMETNSAPHKIHVSESTATLLRSAGKSCWLEAREEQIMAKGKGMMQTYWCEPSTDNSAADEMSNNGTETSYQ